MAVLQALCAADASSTRVCFAAWQAWGAAITITCSAMESQTLVAAERKVRLPASICKMCVYVGGCVAYCALRSSLRLC